MSLHISVLARAGRRGGSAIVRYGSVAEIHTLVRHIRFSAGTRPRDGSAERPLGAISGHQGGSNQDPDTSEKS